MRERGVVEYVGKKAGGMIGLLEWSYHGDVWIYGVRDADRPNMLGTNSSLGQLLKQIGQNECASQEQRNTPTRIKYHCHMRRLLQFGTLLLLLVMFLAPLAELFDRWDSPGLSNDTEFGVFALVLALCLVLVVCMLIAARSLRNKLVLGPVIQIPPDEKRSFGQKLVVSIFIPPRLTPLRI